MNMRINSSYNVNFGSRNLFRVTLKQTGALKNLPGVNAVISELDFSDAARMEKYGLYWDQTQFGYQIIKEFLHDCREKSSCLGDLSRYFIIENPNDKTVERIKGLALAEVKEDTLSVDLLQSERPIKEANSLRGIGSCLLYTIVKAAQEKIMKSVWLLPTRNAEPFYRKIGFKQYMGSEINPICCSTCSNLFGLKNQDFASFQKNMEDIYKITPFA